MENVTVVVEAARKLVADAEKYEVKPTKAGSARMRSFMGTIKKHTADARRELVNADKGGK